MKIIESTQKVSWVRVDEAAPSLLSVGQFVFTADQRISVGNENSA